MDSISFEGLEMSISNLGSGSIVIDNVFMKYTFIDYSKPLVVSFASAGEFTRYRDVKKSKYSPWGYEYLKKKGINVISFSPIGGANWYRSTFFSDFIQILAPLLECFPTKIGYGGSMGGYAAGAFSKLFEFDRVLLINPISTLNSTLAPWDKIPRKHQRKLNWDTNFHDGADLVCDGLIVYDPLYSNDAKHAKRYRTLKHIRFPGVGHSIPKHLQALGLLNMLVEGVINENLNESAFYSKLRSRRFYPGYYRWMLSKQNKHLTPNREAIIKLYHKKFLSMINLSVSNRYSENYVDMLRDDALKIEKDNIHLAYSLMTRALELRPNGVLIKRKVAEYELKINKKI